MGVNVLVGGFFGDEGKGKIISHLARRDDPDIVVRGGAGPNAGHTVRSGQTIYKIRMLPSGFLNPNTRVMIGPGVVVNPRILLDEIRDFGAQGRAFVDGRCGIIDEHHIRDDATGNLKRIGSTGSGTGPANAERAMRTLRMARDIGELRDIITDVPGRIHQSMQSGGNVLVEGTQGTFLSLWHGTYPFVTSKDTTASGICADVGIGPTAVDEVIMVVKSFMTRVGGGPMKGELDAQEADARGWSERGTVTNRPRRAAPLDFDLGRRAVMLNGATQIALTKLDAVFPQCAAMTSYDELPAPAVSFIEDVEARLGRPVTIIGTGAADTDIIDRR